MLDRVCRVCSMSWMCVCVPKSVHNAEVVCLYVVFNMADITIRLRHLSAGYNIEPG